MLKKKKKFLLAVLLACVVLSAQKNLANFNKDTQEETQDDIELKKRTIWLSNKLKESSENKMSFVRAFAPEEVTDIEKEVSSYLKYVAQNPRLIIKYQPKIQYADEYKRDSQGLIERLSQFRTAFAECVAKNSKSDCTIAFNFIASYFFKQYEVDIL